MEQEKIHFYINTGIILIILGIVSMIYSTIIPVIKYPYNAFAGWIFLIGGIVLIIVGILLILTMRRRFFSQKIGREGE